MSIKRMSTYDKKKAYKRLLARDGDGCQSCGKKAGLWCQPGGRHLISFDSGVWASYVFFRPVLEVDHRLALHLGGTNDDENLWLLCHGCHKKKTSSEQSARLKALGAGRNAK